MPIFEVSVEDIFDRTVEETWRSYESFHVTRVLRIEAEDEEEAEELARDGYGDVISEEDYSETYESEHWDTGDILYEEHTDTNVDVRTPRLSQQGLQRTRGLGNFGWLQTNQTREPDWEV